MQVHPGLSDGFAEACTNSLSPVGPGEQRPEPLQLANAIGGRVFYGIDEERLPDGTVVAGKLEPLLDGSTGARLTDILNTTIQPRIRFDVRHVPISSGGTVLVLEVSPSSALDLHQVSGYNDNRFYRRVSSTAIPMAEFEVREAYFRIAEARASLDTRVRALAEPEFKTRDNVDESILVIPLFSRPGLLDPREIESLGSRLLPTLRGSDLEEVIAGLRTSHDGYRLAVGGKPGQANLYLSILKSGVVHLSPNNAFLIRDTEFEYLPWNSVRRILEALLIAREVLSLSHYWGGVRVLHRLRPTKTWRIQNVSRPDQVIPPGTYDSQVGEVNLYQTSGRWDSIVRELLDPPYHAAGLHACPFIDASGIQLSSAVQKQFELYLKLARFQSR